MRSHRAEWGPVQALLLEGVGRLALACGTSFADRGFDSSDLDHCPTRAPIQLRSA